MTPLPAAPADRAAPAGPRFDPAPLVGTFLPYLPARADKTLAPADWIAALADQDPR